MPASTATIALKLESKDFAAKANDASTALLGVQLAAGGTGLALKGMGALARSSAAELVLGAVAVDKFNTNLGKAAANAGKLSGIAGSLSTFAYNTALATTAISGLVEATSQFNRIPQALAAISASGVSTQTIEEFHQLKEAIGGNQAAVEGFVNVAIARLGVFEQAAARSATILKSSTRFDESGNALRVNGAETLANALSIQQLVTNKLDNAVTSSAALLAQYEVLSAGFASQQDSEKVLETALKLTQIGQAGGVASNAGDNAKLVGKSLQAYNLGAGDAARTGAILNEVVAQGITTVPELSNGFGAAGSSAAKAGISMSALGAGVAQLTSLGQDTSEALTGLKGLSDAIINKTPEAAAALAQLSLNGQRIRFDTAEVQAKGLVQALLDVNKAAGNSPQILAKIFPDAVTSRAVTGLISGGGAGFKSRYEAINSASAASLDEVAQKASDTQVNRMEKLANKFGEIIISIAQSVAPVVEPGLEKLKQIADVFAAIPEPVKRALGTWISAQIVIQSTTAAIGTLIKTLGDLAGIYAIGRLIGLTMTGQLGSELTVIKQLIVQRKGLAAVMLQTIGINQRHRLGVDAATAALTNQGIVAKGAYAAQAKGAELLAAASSKARDIFARNVAGARAAAVEFATTPTAGRAVNTGVGLVEAAKNSMSSVANSQTGQNVRGAVGDFLENRPYIGEAATDAKAAAATALKRAKAKYNEIVNSDLAQNLTSQAKNKAGEIGNAASSLKDRILTPDSGATDRQRLQQLIDAELQLNKSKLVTTVNETRSKFAELDKETAFKQRVQDNKREELVKKEDNFSKRAARLEEIKDKISPEDYQKGIAKLNQSGQKIQDLEKNIQENVAPLAQLQRDRARVGRQLVGSETRLASANIAAQERFTPLVNLEARRDRINAAYDRAQARAGNLETYANNLNRVAPGTAQAAAATNAAGLAAITQSSLAGRAQRMEREYQALLTTSGARTALLAQQGLAQVRYGAGTATYSTNSRLESLLYADVGKGIKTAFESTAKFISGLNLSGTFIYLRSTAQAAAAALGRIGSVGLVQAVREGLSALPGRLIAFGRSALAGARSAYQSGGVLGVARTGYGAAISGAEAVGQRFLPFLPTAIAGAIVAPTVVAAIGAVALRDDFKRSQLAGEFRSSVEETLKKDAELRGKYEDRNRPLAQLKSAVAEIADGKVANFSLKATPTTIATTSGALDTALSLPGRAIDGIGSGLGAVGNALDRTVAPSFTLDGVSAFKPIDPVREQLKLLAQSGQLTADQFKDLDGNLSKMGASGKISAAELENFNNKLRTIASQEKPQAKGVLDSIGSAIYNAPGAVGNFAGGTADLIANSFGAVLGGKSLEETARNRQADALISYLGDGTKDGSLTSLTAKLNEAAVETRQNLVAYRQGDALDATNAEKIRQGKELTSADVEREKLQTTDRIDRNNNLVADHDTKLKALNEQLAKQTDPANKALLTDSIKAYTAQKDALVKNTEGLKAAEAAFNKYHSETLPGLIRALKETQDPTKAVGVAAEDFNNIYQKDSAGNITKYVKDIAQLRSESAKYVEAIGTKYSIDNTIGAEESAIEGLKAARDNQITLSTGDFGYRETIANQLSLTDQIVKVQQAGSQKLIAAKTLESEKLKVLTSSGTLAEQEAKLKSQDLSIDVIETNLKAKEAEIQEYARFPRKVVELEQQAATMRVQLEQQVADKQRAIRERDFALRQSQFDLQSEYLKTAQAELRVGGVDAIERASNIELSKAKDALDKLYQDRIKLTERNPELDNQIELAEQKYRQQQANSQTQIFDANQQLAKQLIGLNATRQTQPLTIENKQIEANQKIGDLRSSLLATNRELLTTSLDIQQSQLTNEGKLANSAVTRADLELTSAKAKLTNLDAVQSYERQSLILQQQLTELGLKSQQNQLNISRIEQQRTIKELELQQLKLARDKSDSPEIKAQRQELDYQINAAKIQLTGLDIQAGVIDKQLVANQQITAAKIQQNAATAANAKETERINVLLADINAKSAKITDRTEKQNLLFTAQTQSLTARSNVFDLNTKQLETQTKLLTTQQGLISATADSRVGELGVMNNLTTIDSVKLSIAQQVATVKLASLTAQIKYEKDILELNIQQQDATYRQDKIKQEISEKNAERDILNSRAAYEKLLIKGDLADPNEKRAAELDLAAKLDNQALVRGNREILARQGQYLEYSAQVQRIQLDLTQRGKLQSNLAEVGENLPDTQKANFQNRLFNAAARGEGTEYFKEWADGVVNEAKRNPIVLPQFGSPYSGNYNRPGVADPNKLAPSAQDLYRSTAGSIDFSSSVAPSLTTIDTSRYQQDAQARYREFVANPVQIQISPQVRESQQQGRREESQRRRDEDKSVKPIVIQNLHMTNDLKLSIANSTEAKSTVESNVLESVEGIARLIKEKLD